MKTIAKIGYFQIILAWYDLWVGAYYDVGHRTLYICPLPCIVLRFEFVGTKDEKKHRPDRHFGEIDDAMWEVEQDENNDEGESGCVDCTSQKHCWDMP